MTKPFEPELTKEELKLAFPNLKLIKIIKSGGEGTVFEAFNNNDIKLAIKVYSSNHLKTRTELEVKKLSLINNPYIAKLYNYGNIVLRNESCYFTQTAFIEGSDLRLLINQKHKFNYEDVIKMIMCISSCINDLWKQKVVHCDIKPDNIIQTPNNDYILIDLGMAKHLDAETMTAEFTIMGTFGYIAPEQFKGRKNLTLKTDYYALGITAYELLTGYHPFNRNQRAMLTQPAPEFPIELKIPICLKKLIMSMIDPIAINRPMNHFQITESLKEVL